ncbi:MAG: single-stranded DNA-binding protein, partial [Bacteroidia bacterium]
LYIVGKIKTRSYVDKDGNNKYITEILADTFLVLDKKQVTPTSADTGKTGFTEKESSGPDLNEPPAGYQPTNEDDLRF